MITFEQSDEFFPEQHLVTYAQSLIPPMKNLPFDATLPQISSHKIRSQDKKLKFKMQKQSKTM